MNIYVVYGSFKFILKKYKFHYFKIFTILFFKFKSVYTRNIYFFSVKVNNVLSLYFYVNSKYTLSYLFLYVCKFLINFMFDNDFLYKNILVTIVLTSSMTVDDLKFP